MTCLYKKLFHYEPCRTQCSGKRCPNYTEVSKLEDIDYFTPLSQQTKPEPEALGSVSADDVKSIETLLRDKTADSPRGYSLTKIWAMNDRGVVA